MAQFPSKEEDVLQLAEKVLAGLKDNKATYPEPAVDLAEFAAAIDSYRNAAEEQEKANTVKKLASIKKNKAFTVMKSDLKIQLRSAEIASDSDDEKLKLIGWGGMKEKTALLAPGQPRALKAARQPDASLELSWNPPAGGGKVRVYRIIRSVNAEPVAADAGDEEIDWVGDWKNVETTCAAGATLTDQPKKIRLVYKVIAFNKAGEGPPSDVALAVL